MFSMKEGTVHVTAVPKPQGTEDERRQKHSKSVLIERIRSESFSDDDTPLPPPQAAAEKSIKAADLPPPLKRPRSESEIIVVLSEDEGAEVAGGVIEWPESESEEEMEAQDASESDAETLSPSPPPRKGKAPSKTKAAKANGDKPSAKRRVMAEVPCAKCGEDVNGEGREAQYKCSDCAAVYHPECAADDATSPPRRKGWVCGLCLEVTQLTEVEKILAVRDLPGGAKGEREVHCKLHLASYRRTRWLPLALFTRGRRAVPGAWAKLRCFLGRLEAGEEASLTGGDGGEEKEWGVDPQWKIPERIIARRPSSGPGPPGWEYLVKWRGLSYDDCTFEPEAELQAYPEERARFEGLGPISEGMEEKKRQWVRQWMASQAASSQEGGGGDSFFDFLPKGLALHDYQLEGVRWLTNAWEYKKPVILADEMGLGKTVQTLVFLRGLLHRGIPGPHLVVAPLSTIDNWANEAERWCGNMNVIQLVGSHDARSVVKDTELWAERGAGAGKPKEPRFHILLTSYEIAIAEAPLLRQIQWETLTVDEGHRLKSKSSRLFKELDRIASANRVLLTGTPIQNNLEELMILLRFLDPVKFGDTDAALAEFSDISREDQIAKLHAMLAPHLLRRMKKDVRISLPPRKEVVVPVEMSEPQREVYKQILTNAFPTLAGQEKKQRMTRMTNLLMQLRKCCNHSRLLQDAPGISLPPEPSAPAARLEQLVHESGKLTLLDRLCPRLKAAGHRLVIFSQFTSTLDLIEEWVALRGWGYQRVDGAVAGRERQKRIDAFNARPADFFCFLLSTRAGGLGINLASADTVVIFDSDWNPHNDLQAQARAHRLGQTKEVLVYRLVTRGSVEERMLAKARSKLVLEHVVVRKMAPSNGASLKQEELDEILRHGTVELFREPEGGEGDRIIYDDAAISLLLDRAQAWEGVDTAHPHADSAADSAAAGSEKDTADQDFLGSFKVAKFEVQKDERGAAAAKLVVEEPGAGAGGEGLAEGHWEDLLGSAWRRRQGAEEERLAAELGAGRKKKAVSYKEFMGSSDDSGSDYRSDSDSGSDDSDSHHDAPPSAKPPKPLASSAPVTAVHIPIAAAPSAAAAPTSHVHMQPHVQSQSLLTLQQVQRLQAQYEVQRRAQLQAQGAGGSGANEAGVGPYSAGGAAGAAGGVLGGPPSRKAVVTPLAQLFQSLATTNAWIATTGQSYHHIQTVPGRADFNRIYGEHFRSKLAEISQTCAQGLAAVRALIQSDGNLAVQPAANSNSHSHSAVQPAAAAGPTMTRAEYMQTFQQMIERKAMWEKLEAAKRQQREHEEMLREMRERAAAGGPGPGAGAPREVEKTKVLPPPSFED